MSTCVTLHLQTQVVSILEALAKSAIAEICKVIDEGTAVLRLEIFQSKKENDTLKSRLLQMEKQLQSNQRSGKIRALAGDSINSAGDEIRGTKIHSYEEERSLSIDGVFGKEWSNNLWKDGDLTAMKEEEAPLQLIINEEAIQTVEGKQDPFPVKMELFEENLEDSDPKSSGGLEPERDSTERQYGEESDPQPASAEETEEPYTQPTAAGDRLEQHTLHVTMEGTAEPHTPPVPPESTAGSEDAHQYFLRAKKTNVAKRLGRMRLACTHCGKNFSYFCSFDKHQQTCSSRSGKHLCEKAEKPFSCNGCGKYYLEKWHLNSHLCSPSGEEPFKCINCGNSFSQEVHLSLHQCLHRRERTSSCVKTGDNSSQKSEFESQQRVYREGNFYSCAACQKSFTDINMFNQHVCNRTGKELHRCLVCGKCFTQRGSLTFHHRTVHSEKKPYSCAECGKNFSQKGNLQRHQAVHTGEKPYKCFECGKRFTGKEYLKNHQIIHRGLKPYRCRVCGKCFSWKNNRNSHERRKHGSATISALGVGGVSPENHPSPKVNKIGSETTSEKQ